MDNSNSKSKSLHDNKISQIRGNLEKEKNYTCIKNFPIFVDKKVRKIDLVCFKDGKVLGLEVDSDVSNSQTRLNVEKLKKLKELFSQKNKIELCEFDMLLNKCIGRKKGEKYGRT